jgi:hypothetical protein
VIRSDSETVIRSDSETVIRSDSETVIRSDSETVIRSDSETAIRNGSLYHVPPKDETMKGTIVKQFIIIYYLLSIIHYPIYRLTPIY